MEEELSTACRAAADTLEILSNLRPGFYEKCYTSDKQFNGSLCQSSTSVIPTSSVRANCREESGKPSLNRTARHFRSPEVPRRSPDASRCSPD